MIAAIDVGSNAMRAVVAYVDSDGRPQKVDSQRAAVRLGQDVFQGGSISEATTARAIEALSEFRELFDRHHVLRWRAVGTSALRDAENAYEFIAKVNWATGLDLEAIGGDEEARLAFRAISDRKEILGKTVLLIDIGGGSAEISIVQEGQLVSAESFKMGAVRMLQIFAKQAKADSTALAKLVKGYVEAIRHRLSIAIGKKKVDLCVGIGGNIEAFADLRHTLLRKPQSDVLTSQDLGQLLDRLKGITFEERIEKLGLRPDRADVVIPAAVVMKCLMDQAKVRRLLVPRVGLKEGMLIEIAEQSRIPDRTLGRLQVISASRRLGARFHFDERHAETVATFALQIFDAINPVHGLSEESRLLLEVAAWLHDIGQFIGITDHHKHSAYILGIVPIIGLSPLQRKLVANVVRYHHKSLPKARHEYFAALSDPDKDRVRKLIALLRLADAMDFEHDGLTRIEGITHDRSKHRLDVKLGLAGDPGLVKWAVHRHADYFEEMFLVSVNITNGE